MMTDSDRDILDTFSRQLREQIPGAGVYAFGSRVSGTAETDSDLDVCVVVPHLDHAVRDTIREVAWQVGFDRGVLISTVKFTEQAFRHGAVASSPLVRTIMAEGIAA
jgi:predicted nucleotidyltransferase